MAMVGFGLTKRASHAGSLQVAKKIILNILPCSKELPGLHQQSHQSIDQTPGEAHGFSAVQHRSCSSTAENKHALV